MIVLTVKTCQNDRAYSEEKKFDVKISGDQKYHLRLRSKFRSKT